ncbi:MAG TPA: class I tRNA ligase family protein [Candidatus Polarisedimenticolaceae bacterium]|nr:class I tRNA ligase family protein [Candidatus Polarisedimenticolaceae bacterium]
MKRAYNPHVIEPKWRAAWDRAGCDRAPDLPEGPKFFNYDSGPFPNGPLHMGHVRTYVLGDVTARYQRLAGRCVLYATEWDAFGLPNELEALAEDTDPRSFTRRHIQQMRAQMRQLGVSYDYARIRDTSDPAYYRWTQWLFLELLERGLVERREAELPWCPSCTTALAAMQVERGACWRCGTAVETRRLPQWFVDLSPHAKSLDRDLDALEGWSERARNGLRAAMVHSGRSTAWLVSRQRAWGTPIPIVHCGSCGAVPVPREELPVRPGEVETPCPRCGSTAQRETDTLDCFFDDVWCFYSSLVPIDRPDATVFPSPQADAWMPVDCFHSGYDTLIYLHLHRFLGRVLAESGHVRHAEPIRGTFGHDLVLASGRKMSKHLGNAVSPTKLLRVHGADATRVAVLWAAGPSRTLEWSPRHIGRAEDFLDAFYRLCARFPSAGAGVSSLDATRAATVLEGRTLEVFAEVARYIESYRPNVGLERLAFALKSVEEFLGQREGAGRLAPDDRAVVSAVLHRFAIALVPFAPHLAEEACETMGHPPFAVRASWPVLPCR